MSKNGKGGILRSEKRVLQFEHARETYCNVFVLIISRQRLGKHVPPCNNERSVLVDECYSSMLLNSQRANKLAG
jgi:hypothetical protein